MADIYVGESAINGFQVLDSTGPPGAAVTSLTGANFDWTLKRRTGTNDFAAASESVTITERGSGTYEASFTVASDADGYIYWLQVQELDNFANSAEETHDWFLIAASSADTATESDAFCALADVSARCGRGSFSTTSTPTSAQVLEFMAMRANQIAGALAKIGFEATPASGGSPISTSSDAGSRISSLCRQANALFAAGDASFVYEVRDTNDPLRAKALYADAESVLTSLVDYVTTYVATTSAACKASFDDDYDVDDLPFTSSTVW